MLEDLKKSFKKSLKTSMNIISPKRASEAEAQMLVSS